MSVKLKWRARAQRGYNPMVDKKIRILLLEDNPGDVRLIEELLKEKQLPDFILDTCDTLAKGLQSLEENSYNVILLDLGLPGSRGIGTLRTVFSNAPDIPIIVMTGLDDEDTGIEAVREGAQDYFVKGAIERDLFIRAIYYSIERKQAERNINFLASIVQNVPDAVCAINTEGCIISWNNGAENMLGYSEKEIIGQSIMKIIPEEMGEKEVEHFVNLLNRQGALKAYQSLRIAKNGRKVPIEMTAMVLRDESGGVTGYAAIMRDISERLISEQKIYRLNRLYTVLSELNIMIVKVRDRKELLYQVCRIAVEHGLFRAACVCLIDPPDSLARPVTHWGADECFVDSVRISVADDVDESDPIGHAIKNDTHYVCNDLENGGTTDQSKKEAIKAGYRSFAVFPVKTEGKILGAVSVYSDETNYFDEEEIKLLNEMSHDISFALEYIEKEAQEVRTFRFIDNILESINEGLIVVDPQFRILKANRAYGENIQMSPYQVVGRHCHESSYGLERPCYEYGEECPVKYTLENGLPGTALHYHKRDSGGSAHVEVKSYPLRDEKGNITAVIELINDITEKVDMENQLRHAQKMEAVGALAGGIAHDFNNALNAIMGFGTVMQMNMEQDSPHRHHLKEILHAVERAAQLTKGLLSFSRKQDMVPKIVNINDIVQGVQKMLSRIIGEDIELKAVLSNTDLAVMADRGQIEQVLMNIATNARDAMPEGGSLVIETGVIDLDTEFIRIHGYGKRGRYALITVSDTGIGIDNELKQKVFDPFFTTKELGKGTGLGLSIVYGIIKQHDGFINFYSEPEMGTTFSIYLPLAQSAQDKEEIVEESEYSPARGTETVFVIEDDEILQRLMRSVLEEYGYTVLEALDGDEALDTFMENRDAIDLLLVDMVLPKKSGKEVYEEIKRIRPDIGAIFLSGYSEDIVMKRGFNNTDIPFIFKPCSPMRILEKVRQILDSRV